MLKILKRLLGRRNRLIDRIPDLKGKVLADEPLAKKNWLGVGGNAEVYVEPADVMDLMRLMKAVPEVPLTILGAGSNVLILDGGVPGVTVRLGKNFAQIRVEGDRLICGAGALVKDVARVAEKNNLSGFEFLSGIPGTVGGAVRMNAGAFGQSFGDRMVRLTSLMGNGNLSEIDARKMAIFEYRRCCLPEDWIFLEVALQGERVKDPAVIREKTATYKKKREEAQPQGVRTAGSTFKNPDGLMAWKLIDKAGLRGFRVGGAVVSEKHANFLVNDKGASARDIENLGAEIQRRIRQKYGVRLEWEIKKIGVRK